MSGFIPAGRTSLVKRGETMLQVQTEYAHRPYPRITTTILNQGQVLHKLEKKLDHAISTVEEQNIAEDVMKRQHAEVLSLIVDPSGEALLRSERARNEPTAQGASSATGTSGPLLEPFPELPDLSPQPDGLPAKVAIPAAPSIAIKESLHDRFADIPDFQHAFAVTLDGHFKSAAAEDQFRRAFKRVHKNIRDVINVFPECGGAKVRREEGVFEVERDELYLVSTGDELFFITIQSARMDLNYEKVIKNLLFPDELQVYFQQNGEKPR